MIRSKAPGSDWFIVLGDVCSTVVIGWPAVLVDGSQGHFRPQLSFQQAGM